MHKVETSNFEGVKQNVETCLNWLDNHKSIRFLVFNIVVSDWLKYLITTEYKIVCTNNVNKLRLVST